MARDIQLQPVTIEGATLIFRNFSGAETKFNDPGDRNFAIVLGKGQAEEMKQDGWNVKFPDPREDDEEARDPYLQVKVGYKGRPPLIKMITSVGSTVLTEDTVSTLDWADIENADLVIRPYQWEVGDKTGIKAYLQALYVTVREDALARKYALIEQEQQASRERM